MVLKCNLDIIIGCKQYECAPGCFENSRCNVYGLFKYIFKVVVVVVVVRL
jgi:hypothetical protein